MIKDEAAAVKQRRKKSRGRKTTDGDIGEMGVQGGGRIFLESRMIDDGLKLPGL